VDAEAGELRGLGLGVVGQEELRVRPMMHDENSKEHPKQATVDEPTPPSHPAMQCQ